MVWLDDPSLKFTVDDEFKAMWQHIKVPDAAAVAAALQKERLVPASKIQVVKKVAKAPEKKKKKARKSKGADDEDVEMEDAEAPKSTKKRKTGAESDAEGGRAYRT